MEILGYAFALLFGALCLVLSYLASRLGVPTKYTRKLVHVVIGFEWVILYAFLGAGIHSLVICLVFLALLIAAYFKNLLPMISSDGDNAPGTVYYAVSMSVIALVSVFLPNIMLPFGIAVFCTSFGDGLAGIVGQLIKRHNPVIYGKKSLLGVLTNFAVCFLGVLVFSAAFDFSLKITDVLLIAVFSASLEMITPFGLDNVSVPIGTAALTYALAYLPVLDPYVVAIVLTPLIAAVAIKKRVLTPIGVIAALVLDASVTVAFKNAGFAVILAFLLLSALSDIIKKSVLGKSDSRARDEMQVIANGGAALVAALAYIFAPREAFLLAFVAVMAEALADTVSSAFGVFAKNTYDIFRMKRCRMGMSGGVSVIGTVAALVAAFILPTFAFALGLIKPIFILILGAIAFGGTFIDTLIGSLLQEKYVCPRCGAVTDTGRHCGVAAKRTSGLSFIDNNVTNFISNVAVAIAVILIYMA